MFVNSINTVDVKPGNGAKLNYSLFTAHIKNGPGSYHANVAGDNPKENLDYFFNMKQIHFQPAHKGMNK